MALKISVRDNFLYLTFALLALLFLIAAAEQFAATINRQLVITALVLTLGGAMWTLKHHRRAFRTGLSLVGCLLVLELVDHGFPRLEIRLLQLALLFLYFASMAWFAVRQVLFMEGHINANRLLGAIAVYLLIGLNWAVVYMAVLEVSPAAFNGITVADAWGYSFNEFVYFSYVSLTTLGYGDISPASPVARFLVYLEALTGQLYLAIMVAGLVGVGISKRGLEDQPAKE